MTKIIPLIFMYTILLPYLGISQEINEGIVVTGHIKELEDGDKVQLWVLNDTTTSFFFNGQIVDSCLVRNGLFKMHGHISDGPRMMELSFTRGPHKYKRSFMVLGNERVFVQGTLEKMKVPALYGFNPLQYSNIEVEGSRVENDRIVLMLLMSVSLSCMEAIKDHFACDSTEYKEQNLQENDTLKNSVTQVVKRALYDNPQYNRIIPYLFTLYNHGGFHPFIADEPFWSELFNNLNINIKNGFYGKWMSEHLFRLKGQFAPAFTSTTIDKQSLSLIDVVKRNKLTIIDFWNPGCGSCRIELRRNALPLYQIFHNRGLEIIGVCDDADSARWARAISEDKQPWLNVTAFHKNGGDNNIFDLYQVSAMPSNVLIDEKGIIIAWNVFGNELHWYLDRYLKSSGKEMSRTYIRE